MPKIFAFRVRRDLTNVKYIRTCSNGLVYLIFPWPFSSSTLDNYKKKYVLTCVFPKLHPRLQIDALSHHSYQWVQLGCKYHWHLHSTIGWRTCILAERLTAWIMSLTIIYGIQELILFSKYHNLQIHSFTDKVVIICQQQYPDMDTSFTNGYPIIQTMV